VNIAVSSDHNNAEHLVQMANDIGNFFRAEPVREDAIAGIANHISKFWTKRMRQKIAAHGDAGLDELPREALCRLAETCVAVPKEPPGGDAG
jgi:formate dehydrogenase subunit delta